MRCPGDAADQQALRVTLSCRFKSCPGPTKPKLGVRLMKIKLKNWLAREHNVGTELEGEVKAETEKAILFTGNTEAREAVHCLRCGRNLTHPSSRFVGFGPECSEKLGVPYPSKSELTEEQIEAAKGKLRKLKVEEEWIPKSQSKVWDEEAERFLEWDRANYTVGNGKAGKKEKKEMTKIGVVGKKSNGEVEIKGVALRPPYSDENYQKCKTLQKEFGGKWNKDVKQWEFPLGLKVVEKAQELWEDIEMSELLRDWIEEEKAERQKLISQKEKEDAELETALNDTLYDFQRVGTSFLSQTDGAILADDMGLGKTIQSLAAVDELELEQVLVVCPASLKLNWGQEIEKWLPDYTYKVIDGSKKKRVEGIEEALEDGTNFIIVNYAMFRGGAKAKKDITCPLFKVLDREWDAMIIDEAHRFKNRKAQQTKGGYRVAKKAKKVYHLTGTPIMNKPDEIWSLLHMMDPERYSSYWRFVRQYCDIYDNGWGKEIRGAKNPAEFREMLEPMMVRRTKQEVLSDLPEKTVKQQFVELEGKQRKLYEQMERDMVAKFSEEEEIAAPIVLAQLTRLKQIAVSPGLITDEFSDKSAKVEALMDILEDAGDQKVVVFSQFQGAVEYVASILDSKGIEYGKLHGGVSQEDRDRAIKKFQNDPDCKVFLASIKAGGLGITLTAGSICVFLDKDWTPANNNQAIDRLHRIGQENNVTVIELLAKDTVEEYIEQLLNEKQKTFDSLIEGDITGKEVLLNLQERWAGEAADKEAERIGV